MRVSYWPAPSDDFAEIQSRCMVAEGADWDGIWFSDHLMPSSGDGPVNESFTTLAALAATVPRLRLSHLVAGNTYRHPALVVKMAAGIDRISGGRFVFGLGAAWQQNEHDAFGIPFPPRPSAWRPWTKPAASSAACSTMSHDLRRQLLLPP